MDRLRIDSTQALNSFVLSWTGMVGTVWFERAEGGGGGVKGIGGGTAPERERGCFR